MIKHDQVTKRERDLDERELTAGTGRVERRPGQLRHGECAGERARPLMGDMQLTAVLAGL